MTAPEPLDTWAVIELMGHVTIIGRVTEAQLAGVPVLRIDRPDDRAQYIAPQSLYRLTPCTEDEARRAHQLEQHRYYGPVGLPNSLARAITEPALAIEAATTDRCRCDDGTSLSHQHETDEDGACRTCGCGTPPGDDIDEDDLEETGGPF